MSALTIPQSPPAPRSPAHRPFRFTCEQYYRLGELGFFTGKRVQRIRGRSSR